jgi:hypothetical protein
MVEVEAGGLIRLSDGLHSYELRLISPYPGGAAFAAVGDGPAKRNPDGTLALIAPVAPFNLTVGQSAGFASRTMDAGTLWDVELIGVA